MKSPRLSISGVMAVLCAVALTFAGVRALYAYRPASPTFEALLLGVPLTAFALQVGLFRAVVDRGRARAFWAGFVAFGLVSIGTFAAAFVSFPDSMETPLFVWGAYFELTGVALYRLLPSQFLTQYWFAWWLGAAFLLFLPHVLVASAGGLLVRCLGRAV